MTTVAPEGDRVQGPAATGIAILAALLAGAVLLVLGHPGRAVAALFGLSVLMLLAVRCGSPPAVDAVLMTGLLYLTVAVEVFGLWPLPGAVAVLAAWWLARRSVRASLWRSWLRRGQASAELPWLLLAHPYMKWTSLVSPRSGTGRWWGSTT